MDTQASKQAKEGREALPPPTAPNNAKIAPMDSAGAMQGSLLPYVAASWAKNSRDALQVRLDTYQGRAVVDLRNWYSGTDGELKPAKGLTVSVNHLEQLAAGVNAALAYARRAGLVPEGGGE